MREIPFSKFKATCPAVLEKVRRTGKPVRITRFGEPLAEVIPSIAAKPRSKRLGSMEGTAKITGDIVGPIHALRD